MVDGKLCQQVVSTLITRKTVSRAHTDQPATVWQSGDRLKSCCPLLRVIMFGCQHGWAAQYVINYCLPVSDMTASLFCQLTSSGNNASLSQHVRLLGFCRGWPNSLELSPGQSPGSWCYYRQLQVLVENIFVFSVWVQLAHCVLQRCALQIYILRTYLLSAYLAQWS